MLPEASLTKHKNVHHTPAKLYKIHRVHGHWSIPVFVSLLVHFVIVHTELFYHSIIHTDQQITLSILPTIHGFI